MFQEVKMLSRKFFKITFQTLRNNMTIIMRRSTASTGLSASRRQSNDSLNGEIIQKVLPGLSAPIRTKAMNISIPSYVKAGLFAQAVTRKDSCCFRNTSGENVLLKLPHRQFVFTLRNCCEFISNMTGTSLKMFKDHIFYHKRLLYWSSKNSSDDRSCCFLSVVR